MSDFEDALPLSGVRVLDATNRLGAYGGRLLADFGADVVKIEPLGGGALRRVPPFVRGREGYSLAFAYLEANKRGLGLDVGAESSRQVLRELAANVDVILLTPTPAEPVVGFDAVETGVDWAPESAVVVVVTPFGATGPLRDWRATHLTSCAMSGLLAQHGPVDGPPVVIPGEQMYAQVGVAVATSVLAALREGGQGGARSREVVDLSAHEVLASNNFDVLAYTGASHIGARFPGGVNEYGGTWECADGQVMFFATNARQWESLLDLLGRPDELADPALSDPKERVSRIAEMIAALGPLIKRMGREDFVARGQELGLPSGLVNSMEEFVNDPQTRSRGFFVPVDLGGEVIEAPGAPYLSTGSLVEQYRIAAPRPGELEVSDLLEEWSGERPTMPAAAPLSKIRVLSFGAALAGAFTASVLADLGADVVKIESPVHPDGVRAVAPPGAKPTVEPSGALTSPNFESFNRSVRSLAMDMRNPAAVELFLRLVESADVVLDNFSPRVMPKWGLGHERLAAANPRLVQLSITGFGHTDGPRSHYVAYGGTVCSFVGLTHMWGYGHQTHFDYVAQSHGVLATLAALSARDRTGEGMFVDLAMIEAGSTLMGPMILDWTVNGHETARPGNVVAGSTWSGVVRCSGVDNWIAIEAESQQDWESLVGTIGHPGPASDSTAFDDALAEWLVDKTAFQAARILQAAGVPAAPVQNAEDLYRDPQLRARRGLIELPHPDLGPIEFIAPVHRLMSAPPVAPTGAPRLGAHGAEILETWLGLDERERDELVRAGSYWTP